MVRREHADPGGKAHEGKDDVRDVVAEHGQHFGDLTAPEDPRKSLGGDEGQEIADHDPAHQPRFPPIHGVVRSEQGRAGLMVDAVFPERPLRPSNFVRGRLVAGLVPETFSPDDVLLTHGVRGLSMLLR